MLRRSSRNMRQGVYVCGEVKAVAKAIIRIVDISWLLWLAIPQYLHEWIIYKFYDYHLWYEWKEYAVQDCDFKDIPDRNKSDSNIYKRDMVW